MKTLDRYVARLFAIDLICILAALLAIFIVVDSSVHSAGSKTLQYYAENLPLVFLCLGPVAALLAGVLVAASAIRSRETAAAASAGVSALRLFGPVLAAGASFSLILCLDRGLLVNGAEEEIRATSLRRALLRSSTGALLWLDRAGGDSGQLARPLWVEMDKPGRALSIVLAQQGMLRPEGSGLLLELEDARRFLLDETGVKEDRGEALHSAVALPSDMAARILESRARVLGIHRLKETSWVLEWTLPFVHLPLLLVALAVLVCREPERLHLAMGQVLLMALSFYAAEFILVHLAAQSSVPLLAIPALPAALVAVGIWGLRRR